MCWRIVLSLTVTNRVRKNGMFLRNSVTGH